LFLLGLVSETTTTLSAFETSTETTTVPAYETSTGNFVESTDLLDSTVNNRIFDTHEEVEAFPYKMIMVGMGVIILCFLVFSFIQICSKVRSKRKRTTPCEESGTYHEIPEAHEIVPSEIGRHYNEITENNEGRYIQQFKIQQEKQEIGLYRELISNEIKFENNDMISENISQNMYLTVDNTKNDEEDTSSDSDNRESYIEPTTKEEKHMYTDILDSSYDVTSDTKTGDYIMPCSENDLSTDSADMSESLQQNDTYLDAV
jgi:hypothetical protein